MASPIVTASTRTAASASVEQRIAHEHAAARAHVAHLRDFALTPLDEATARQRGGAILDFLTTGLRPHAAVEEAGPIRPSTRSAVRARRGP